MFLAAFSRPGYPLRRDTVSPEQVSVSRSRSSLVWSGQMKSSVPSVLQTLCGYQAEDRPLTYCGAALDIQSRRLAPWVATKREQCKKAAQPPAGHEMNDQDVWRPLLSH